MKIVTLFFSCVALHNFAKVGAMNDDGGAVRGRGGRGRGGRAGGGRGRRATEFPLPHPDLAAWTNHDHNHPTGVQNPVLDDNIHHPQNSIIISKVVESLPKKWHLLRGELVSNSNITSCNGPYGYAIVELDDSNPSYACLHPFLYHKEHISQEHTSRFPEFIVYVIREGMSPRRLEGVLTTGNTRMSLRVWGGTFVTPYHHRVGHVRYIKTDPINPENKLIDADGDIYRIDE